MSESEAALRGLVGQVGGADAVLAEHVATFGEVIPHLLMADLRRFFVDLVEAGDVARVAVFAAAVEGLASSADSDVRNVVEVSFVEDLVLGGNERDRAAVEAMRPLIGPATAAALAVSERDAS